MMTCKRGDVVLLPFPFSNLISTKKRPALIISSDHFNEKSSDIIAAAITSEPQRIHIPGDYLIRGWQEAGLIAESTIRCSKIITMDRLLINRKIGQLNESDLGEVVYKLKNLFRIP